jgi:hypothetical protein
MTHVVLVSGHLVDTADRSEPRFPQHRVPWVTDQVRHAFDEWRVGPGTTVISGGARGADIIAAEEGHARGAHVVLCLALPPSEFEQQSVDLAGTNWSTRFHRLLHVAEVRRLSEETGQTPAGDEVFARTNEWMVDLAQRLDPQPYAVIVWDGRTGDGPGGTADLVGRLGYTPGNRRVWVIDPTPPHAGRRA